MFDKEIDRNSTECTPPPARPLNPGRRRFTAAGLAGSGVLMTLASRNALATCPNLPLGTTLSGWISGNQSKTHQADLAIGKSPGYWKKHSWPAGAPLKSMLYKDFFLGCKNPLNGMVTCKGSNTQRYPSLQDVISAEIYNNEFGRSMVCAYLNALDGAPTRPTTAEVKVMANLTFKPNPASQCWSDVEILCFLRQTFDPTNV